MLYYAVGLVNICVSYDSGGSPRVRPSVSPFILPLKLPFICRQLSFTPLAPLCFVVLLFHVCLSQMASALHSS